MSGGSWAALAGALVAFLGAATAWLKADLAQRSLNRHVARHAQSNTQTNTGIPPVA